jgi:cytochrome c-type biogenesis protein CcmH/NrfG
MSVRDVFWLCAGMLMSAALAFVLPAFVRALPASKSVRRAAIAGAIGVFAIATLGLYRIFGSPDVLGGPGATTARPHAGVMQGASGESLEAATAKLAARLRANGGSEAEWELLAQSYEQTGATTAAAAARKHSFVDGPAALGASTNLRAHDADAYREQVAKNPADAAAWIALARIERSGRDFNAAQAAFEKAIALHAMSADDWADYADVLASISGKLSGPPAKAIAAALALDANHAKALWLNASLALEERRYADALQDWRRLRAVVADSSSDARIVDANIEEARALAGAAPATQVTAAAKTGADAPIAIRGTVEFDPALQKHVQPGMTLFVFARAAEGGGPPLAVLRTQPTRWPVAFQLDDTLAMLPSRRLSAFDRVIVEARLSKSGQALAQSGDLQIASGVIRTSNAPPLTLRISKIIS